MKKILITGGSGFIGSSVKNALLSLGFELITVGRSEKEDHKLNLNNTNELSKIINNFTPDIICHFASGSNIARASENKEKEFSDTVVGTESIVKVLLDQKTKPEKLVYV